MKGRSIREIWRISVHDVGKNGWIKAKTEKSMLSKLQLLSLPLGICTRNAPRKAEFTENRF
jgi:hypothetical protein